MKQVQIIDKREIDYPGKLQDTISTRFLPAPDGTTAEIYPGISLPVKAFLVSDDNQFEAPVFEMQSDYEWQVSCLNDRLKSPENIERVEKMSKQSLQSFGNGFKSTLRTKSNTMSGRSISFRLSAFFNSQLTP